MTVAADVGQACRRVSDAAEVALSASLSALEILLLAIRDAEGVVAVALAELRRLQEEIAR